MGSRALEAAAYEGTRGDLLAWAQVNSNTRSCHWHRRSWWPDTPLVDGFPINLHLSAELGFASLPAMGRWQPLASILLL